MSRRPKRKPPTRPILDHSAEPSPPAGASTAPANASSATAAAAPSDLTWTVHPAREQPRRTVAALVIVVLFGAVSSLAASWWPAGIIAAGVLVLVLDGYFFPTKFVIDAQGVTFEGLLAARRLCWADVRRWERGPRAAWLSPLARRSWREGRQGVLVLFGQQRDQVLAALENRLGALAPDPPRR